MARFCGKVGYVETQETAPGVHSEVFTEYTYVGDVLRNLQRWDQTEYLLDNLTLNSRFSLIGDAFAYESWPMMRYIIYNGVKWKITSVEILRPRLIITVGGKYNV